MKAPLLAAALALFAAVASPTHAQTRRGTKPDFPSQNAARTSGTAPQNTPTSASENGKLDYRNPAADPLIPVEADKRKPITDDLQATVTELLALYHESKQAHWNIRGPLYVPLHEQLQENADEYLKFADLLAERVLEIGNPVDGRPAVIAATANIGEFPGGFLSDKQVLILLAQHVDTVAKRVRQRIEHLSKIDEVTSNKLQDLSYELDKHVWKFRVHMQ